MAKSRQPRKKKPVEPTRSVEERLAQALSQRPQSGSSREDKPPPPSVGDKVTFPQSDTVYTVSRVSLSGTQVDLHLEGTNIERFRVSIADLDFLNRPTPRPPAKPAKPAIDVEAIRERLTTAQHSSMDQISGDIAVLKKYLRSKGVSASAINALDDLCEETEKRWADVVEQIIDSLD
ncbi:hypothetical protein [Edaphobacter aggregans]|uniref:hypothetical protein n=1 Tax=Edaphobacter aggregans TaxID=570835 RepID=UPI00054E66BD|nr:hypothetical protein [Edaphobacter aggregans]